MKKISHANVAICGIVIVLNVFLILQAILRFVDFALTHTEYFIAVIFLSHIIIPLTVVCITAKDEGKLYNAIIWIAALSSVNVLILTYALGNMNRFIYGFALISMICSLVLIFTSKPRTTLKMVFGVGYAIMTFGLAVLLVLGLMILSVFPSWDNERNILTSSLSPNEVYYVEIFLWSGGAATDFSNRVTVRRYPRGQRETVFEARGWHFHGYDGIAPIYWDGDYAFRIYSSNATRVFERIEGNWIMVLEIVGRDIPIP